MSIVVKNAAFSLLIIILEYSALEISTPYSNAFAESFCGTNIPDQPLFLTPYIESGDVETGRSLSKVGQLPNAPNVPSYSGFFTVNKEYNSNLFFWFFPALNNNVKAPLILWLQGGPGTTDLFGLFVDHGPYILYSNSTAGRREHTWAKEFHVLYVDSPVGTGFSFTDNEKGYATYQDQITDNLYEFLKQFFEVYYEYRHNDFYICGETYAGKHVPHLGYKLHTFGPPADITFKGISVGNGLFDVYTKIGYEELLYQLGIITKKQASFISDVHSSMVQHQQTGELLKALKYFNQIYGIYKDPYVESSSYLTELSGYEFYYDFLITQKPQDYLYYIDYIQSPQSRRAIHVGNLTFHNGDIVLRNLLYDILEPSTKDKLAVLMDNNYKVLLYYGQLDTVLPYVTVNNLLQNLKWKYADEYWMTDRKVWRLGNYIAGYVHSVRNFYVVLVRNAGHFAIRDQPQAVLDMITRVIKYLPF